MKTCFKCGLEQPLSCFYKHPRMADGHLNKCKECTKRDAFKHRRENIDRVREYDRERSKLPHRVEDAKARSAEYRKKNPLRYRANNMVNNAIRDGKLEKQPCFCCGSINVEAHHVDYSRPLSVVWLCPEHHREIHVAFPDDHYDQVHDNKPPPDWQRRGRSSD